VSPTTFTSQTEHPAESNEFQKLLTQFYDTYAIEGLIVWLEDAVTWWQKRIMLPT